MSDKKPFDDLEEDIFSEARMAHMLVSPVR
jgi:hypothetical protein